MLLALLWTATGWSQTPQTGVEKSQYRLARQFEQLGQYEQAAQIYRSLSTNYPQNYTYFDGLRRNLLKAKKYDELVKIIQDRLLVRPADVQLEAQLGDVYFQMGQEEQAYQVWNGLLQKYAGNVAVYRLVASAMLQNRLFDRAIQVYLKGRAEKKDPSLFSLELAQLYTYQQLYPQAVTEYLHFVQKMPYQLSYVRAMIARLPLNEQTYPPVEKVLKLWVKKNRKSRLAHQILAGFYQSFGNYNAALAEILKLESLPGRGKKHVAGADLYRFALDMLHEKEYAVAKTAFQELLNRFPAFNRKDQAVYYLADVAFKTGDFEKAKELYRQVVEKFPKSSWSLEASLRMGSILLDTENRPAEAIPYFQRIRKNFAGTRQEVEATFSLADCFLRQGKLDKAVAIVQEELNAPYLKNGRNRELREKALLKLAQLQFYRRDFVAANKQIAQLLKASAGRYDSPSVNDAIELQILIKSNERKFPGALKGYATGLYLEKRGLAQAAVDTLLKAVADFNHAPLADRALLEAARLKEKMKDPYGAIRIYQMLVNNYPKSVYADLALNNMGKIYEKDIKDFEKARQTYESVLIQYPNSVLADELRAKLRSLEGQP